MQYSIMHSNPVDQAAGFYVVILKCLQWQQGYPLNRLNDVNEADVLAACGIVNTDFPFPVEPLSRAVGSAALIVSIEPGNPAIASPWA
jgi:hypothetical protein